jgi:hypothetical protein
MVEFIEGIAVELEELCWRDDYEFEFESQN